MSFPQNPPGSEVFQYCASSIVKKRYRLSRVIYKSFSTTVLVYSREPPRSPWLLPETEGLENHCPAASLEVASCSEEGGGGSSAGATLPEQSILTQLPSSASLDCVGGDIPTTRRASSRWGGASKAPHASRAPDLLLSSDATSQHFHNRRSRPRSWTGVPTAEVYVLTSLKHTPSPTNSSPKADSRDVLMLPGASPPNRSNQKEFGNQRTIVLKCYDKRGIALAQLARCQREAVFLSEVWHPNIVQLLASVDTADELFLVFEFAPFGDLHSLTHYKVLCETHAKAIVRQVVVALAHIHSCGVVHGDIKPENILIFPGALNSCQQDEWLNRRELLNESFVKFQSDCACQAFPTSQSPDRDPVITDWATATIKICDFGLAQRVGENGSIPFRGVLGTQCYIAPEVLLKCDYGPKIDVWAAGVVTFELLSGYTPFFPPSSSRFSDVTFDDRYWKSISHSAKDFLSRTLERIPSSRISAAQALEHPWLGDGTI